VCFSTVPPDVGIPKNDAPAMDPSLSDYIDKMYLNILKRAPDQPGKTYWAGQYATVLPSCQQLVKAFVGSPEAQGKLYSYSTAVSFVSNAYQAAYRESMASIAPFYRRRRRVVPTRYGYKERMAEAGWLSIAYKIVMTALAALAGAVLIQIGTNLYNDVTDFEKGADTAERTGPLRVTQAGFIRPSVMRRATVLVFASAVAVGSYLIWRGGWPIAVVGFASIAFGLLYTAGRRSLSRLGIADLFVLIFFGPVAVAGTYFVQSLSLRPEVVLAGLAPGLLAVAILLVNNIRDISEDRTAGKRTLVVRIGRSGGEMLYGACLLGAYAVAVLLVMAGAASPWSLLCLLTLPVGAAVYGRLRRGEGRALNPVLAQTSGVLMGYSLLLGVGWNL